MHRLIVGAVKGEIVDHVNGNTLDNRRENLRKCSKSQNAQNSKRHRDGVSGFKGVSFHRRSKTWRARIRNDGREVCLGYFHSPVDAARAYDRAAFEMFGEFAKVNLGSAA